MNKADSNRKNGKTLLMLFTGAGDRRLINKKSSNQIVEKLKSKGIHAEVCKRYKR